MAIFSGIARDRFRLGCLLVVFRNILNEYTTGICVTASAFFRYCYVCHPTRIILTEKRLRGVAICIAIFAVMSLALNMVYFALVFQPRYPYLETPSYEKKLNAAYDLFDLILFKCDLYPYRYGNRLIFDAITCLGIPGVISGYFYVNVIYRLATRNRDQLRNRKLSIAFAVGWLLWVVTWAPHYYITSVNLSTASTSDWPVSFEFLRNLQIVSQNIFLIYSHLNPIILLFVLTPFQTFLLKIRAILFLSHKRGYGISKDDRNPNASIEGQSRRKEQQKNIFRRILLFLSTSIVVTLFSCCYCSFKVETCNLDISERLFHLKTSTISDIYKGYTHFIMDNEDLGSQIMTRKSLCAEKHGIINFRYQRCYFVETYPSRGLNLVEQIEFCKSQNAVLSYPRNKGEMRFIWKVYFDHIGEDTMKQLSFEDDWFIHTGFQLKMKSNVNPEFISADDLFVVSGYQDYWLKDFFDYHYSDDGLLPFFGPAICITSSGFPMRCPADTLKRNSVCSVDLLMSPNEEPNYQFYFSLDF